MIPDNENAQSITINGSDFKCLVCGNDHFWMRGAQLNSAVTTFFNLDWTDKNATVSYVPSAPISLGF
jgi:hypothetical protein